MSDPFLEREKELMKLNESLNSKITFNFKQPKPMNLKPTNKFKKFAINKALKSDTNQAKNRTNETNKLKNDTNIINNVNNSSNNGNVSSSSVVNNDDVKKSYSNTYSTTEILSEKHELDSKDATTFNRNSFINDTHKSFNPIKKCDEQIITDKMGQTLIETIEKAIDTKPSINTAHLNLIPSNICRKNVSSEGIIKFLKAKVTILQQELDLSHQENTKNLDNLTKAVELQKKAEAARCHANNTINMLNAQIQKFQQSESNNALKLKEHDSILLSQRKECDELKLKLKNVHQTNANLEMRLNKAMDDLECLRKNYRTAKNSEKDFQLSLQHERTFYENQLKINQKQRNDLITALKKHMLLIGNLKQQNACLTQSKYIQMSENEFSKILDWNGSASNK